MKPYAESCDQNRAPLLAVIQPLLQSCTALLEIGSGTGQHGVFFAEAMPHLTWHTSDRSDNHHGIRQWLEEAARNNLRGPLDLDVLNEWPELAVDAVFSANTTHIMDWPAVEALFAGVGRLLPAQGLFLLYGPFNYANAYTSESNARFDQWLKQRDPASGIRNFEDLDRLAQQAGMELLQDNAMPANNRTLVWRKQG